MLKKALGLALRLYGAFAVGHMLFKLLRRLRLIRRAQKHLDGLPGPGDFSFSKFDFAGLA